MDSYKLDFPTSTTITVLAHSPISLSSLPLFPSHHLKPGCSTSTLISGSAGTSSMSMSLRGSGSLAGKVILNLGRITLMGVEKVVMYRKLHAISSQSRNETRSLEMYNDILELSRPGMYSDTIHLEATRFLVRQITCGRTKRLVDALKNWHPIEVRLSLSELIAWFDEAILALTLWLVGRLQPIDSDMRAYKPPYIRG
ncbi:hypothetical protein VKT23_015977 [Stygiomarasmius scandens]|uniref:Uncharacterized protein n=1 Tax=Marasmiellus scandens TaxID=2682957 RepID=A0ABR1IVZ6_9AGAR